MSAPSLSPVRGGPETSGRITTVTERPWRRGLSLLVCAAAAAAWAQAPPVDVPRSTVVDVTPLLHDLQSLSADDMEGRACGTAGGAKARAYIIDRFRAAGIPPLVPDYTSAITCSTRRPGANILGLVTGTAASSHYIVVSAHYDHVGVRAGVVFNGADDNASGAAALAAIGGYFVQHRPASSLIIAAFDGEEQGLLGSRAFLRQAVVPAGSILIDLNADMIGRDPHNTLYVVGVRQQPFLKPFVDRIVARAPVVLRIGHDDPKGPGDDWTRDSDHYSFLEAHIPALYFGVEDYDQLHQPSDDYETLTLPFYVRSVETLIDAVREFDSGASTLAAIAK
jgi:hypothetical protein